MEVKGEREGGLEPPPLQIFGYATGGGRSPQSRFLHFASLSRQRQRRRLGR